MLSEYFNRAPPGVGFEGEIAFEGEITLTDVADAFVLERGRRVIPQRWVGAEILFSEGHGAMRHRLGYAPAIRANTASSGHILHSLWS